MKITLCGSIAFIDEMEKISKSLESLGHEVKFPPVELSLPDGTRIKSGDYYLHKKQSGENDEATWEMVHQNIINHFEKIKWSEAILICNFNKNGVVNYLGPNTLIEMGVALSMNKKIYLLHPIPEVSWKEEILGIQPTVISGDLNKLSE